MIVGVIPARAGSKGVVNKNIRLIHGKPMISYVIENAIKSKYIDKIIISTDSEEVRLIGSQYKEVDIKVRDTLLCKDDVTLDDVVLDAISDLRDVEYCVTLQATSPTLKYTTLDIAIEKARFEHADTIISVVNNPHLSWSKKDGKFVPNYKKRLNRQYLENYFLETGAFLISSAQNIANKCRIGGLITLQEISGEEAVDVDTHHDFIIATHILSKNKTALYVNGSRDIGLGHIYRTLEIADEINDKVTIFYNKNITNSELFGDTKNTLVPVNSELELVEILKDLKFDFIINDVLNSNFEYMQALSNIEGLKIINIEDEGRGSKYAHMVVNALLEHSDYDHVYTGHRYYICTKSFLFFEPITIRETIKNVFVCFGGADPANYTEQFINIINNDKKYDKFNFTIVVGKAKACEFTTNLKELKSNIKVLIDVKNIPELMSNADVGITSRGRMSYELAILGIPTASLSQNMREERHTFVCEDNGFNYLGIKLDDDEFDLKLYKFLNLDQNKRLEMHKKLLNNELRDGRSKFINLMMSL